jgi:hypothetical protein
VIRQSWILGGLVALALTVPTAAVATAAPPSPPEGTEAILSQVAPEVLENLATATQTETTATQTRVRAGKWTTSIPHSSGGEISIEGPTAELKVRLPFKDRDAAAHKMPSGPLSYSNGNGTRTVPAVKDDGSVQITTVIEGNKSPEEFRYEFGLPKGASLAANSDGSVTIFDAAKEPIGAVAAPWAKDSNGVAVPSSYRISGGALTQVVDHKNLPGVAYPVVADPWLGFYLIAAVWVDGGSSSFVVNVVPTSWGRSNAQIYTHWAHVDELRTVLNATGRGWALTYSIEQQFLCHVAGNAFEPGTYNLESWRPGVPWATQLNLWSRCNP